MLRLRRLDGLDTVAQQKALDANIWDEVIAILVPWIVQLLAASIPFFNFPILGAMIQSAVTWVLTEAFTLILEWFGFDTVTALVQGYEAQYVPAKAAFSAVMGSNGGQNNAAVQAARMQFKQAILSIIASRGLHR